MKCGCNRVPPGVEVSDYALDAVPSTGASTTLAELRAWLVKNSPSGHWFGKLYVATTIRWDEKSGTFRQKGCSPNYKAGWWTLACCKHDMRRSSRLKEMVNNGEPTVFVFTLAEKSTVRGCDTQALVSVAKVTEHYATMAEYAKDFVLRSGNRMLISSRLSRERHNDGFYGWHFGDCHSDRSGSVGAPQGGHVHKHPGGWKLDIENGHEILISDRFLVWKRPCFGSIQTINQSRYGRNVTDLGTLLKAIPG